MWIHFGINLPDLRGRFLRGTNLGAGNDPDAAGRTAINTGGNTGDKVGSLQNDQFKSHSHSSNAQIGWGAGALGVGWGRVDANNPATPWGGTTSSSGGNETRPVNVNVNYIICYSSSIAAAGTNSSVFQGSISSAQLPNSIKDSSRITDNDGSAKVQALSLDRIVFTTNSNEAMRITSTGKVGVGTTTVDSTLTVAGGIKAQNIRVTAGAGAGAGKVLTSTDATGKATWQTPTASPWTVSGSDVYRSSGKVGIGTTNPTAAIEVIQDGSPQVLISPKTTNTGAVSQLRLMGATNKSDSSMNASILFGNYDQDFTSTKFIGSISGDISNHAQNEGDMVFYRYPDGNTATESIRIERFGTISFHSGNDAYTFPTTRGSNNQVLTTNGSGVLSWANVPSSADNLGNHTATSNLQLNSNWLSNDGGNEGIRVTNVGDVGIGTGSPETKLHLHTAASVGQYLQITNGTSSSRGLQVGINNAGVAYILQKENFDFKIRTNNIDRMTILAGGNVGIGTATPDSFLTVAGGINAENIRLSNGAGANKVLTSDATGSASWQSPTASPWTISGSDVYRSSGNVGIGTATPNGLLQFTNGNIIRKIVLNEGADNDFQFSGFGINGGSMLYSVHVTTRDHIFYSGASTTTRNELMCIKGTGNVGIGTTNPIGLLHVFDTTANVIIESSNNLTWAAMRLTTPNANFSVISGVDTSGFMIKDNTANVNRLVIDKDGWVGIGTKTPQAKMHISSGDLLLDNTEELQGENSSGTAVNLIKITGANHVQIGESTIADIKFNSGSANNAMTIKSGGDVGIGTTTPP